MVDVYDLRNAAATLREWANEIRRENTPAPYAGANEDIAMLEKVADLLNDAATEILALRTP